MSTPASPTTNGLRFLGLDMQSEVLRRHFIHFLIANFALIMLASFLPQMQAYMFSEFLHLPQDVHGRTSGMLNFWNEIVIIIVVALVGPLSDTWGRKPLMVGGFFIMAIALVLHPQARSVADLLVYRCVFAVGVAAVTVLAVTLLADYVHDRSRGKGAGLQGVMNGLFIGWGQTAKLAPHQAVVEGEQLEANHGR